MPCCICGDMGRPCVWCRPDITWEELYEALGDLKDNPQTIQEEETLAWIKIALVEQEIKEQWQEICKQHQERILYLEEQIRWLKGKLSQIRELA